MNRRRSLGAALACAAVLGLDHETHRCARMNPSFDDSGTPDQCPERSLKYWLAHPLTADDLRGLRAIYD